jgi:two-component system response regulator RpfG
MAASLVPDGTPKVLVVERDALVLGLLERLLTRLPGCEVVGFSDTDAALAWCRTEQPSAVVTGHEPPLVDALTMLRRVTGTTGPRTPVMVIANSTDGDIANAAFANGAADCLRKPVNVGEVAYRVRNLLLLSESRCGSHGVPGTPSSDGAGSREHDAVFALAYAAEYRDATLGRHVERVAAFTRILTESLGLADTERELFTLAAPLHDVGKVGIPDTILLKERGLTVAETRVARLHTVIGYGMLRGGGSDLMRLAADVALSHHERYDGDGYPHGLSGDRIPLAARVVAVADVFDVLTSARSYKRPWTVESACAYVRERAGTQFDPVCVDAFEESVSAIFAARDALADAP